MAKDKGTEVAEKPAATPKESKYVTLTVRVFKGIEGFDPISALTALADVDGYVTKTATGKKSGNVTFTVDTHESAQVSGRGRPKRLVSKEDEGKAIKLLKAAMKDPSRAPQIAALLAANAEGKDVSGELQELVGLK